MTIGVGGSTAEQELAQLTDMTQGLEAITEQEFQQRINKACKLMAEQHIDALYLNAGTNLYYFTGTQWYPSERLVGAILFQTGELEYICPYFEIGTLAGFMQIKGEILGWQEHESPYQLVAKRLTAKVAANGKVGLDETTPFFMTNGLAQANQQLSLVNGNEIIAACRMLKSPAEIAILQRAKDITLEVQKAAARILRPNISVKEVTHFINQAHIKTGVASGNYFCIVLFGKDSQYPHGVKQPQNLVEHDVVLIDTGCELHGYHSDITRTYIYGEPTARHREIWHAEQQAQLAAFNQAQLGNTCDSVDQAARDSLAKHGLNGDYQLPGLPHRVGHGTGLDIHEYPYLVKGNQTKLEVGMVMSNEPMICVPNEFGIRHEDHFYMTEQGPKWFTEPMASIDDPFGYQIR